jgi:hypothetical protein
LVIGALTPCWMPSGDMTLRPLEDNVHRRTANDVDEEMILTQGGDYESPSISIESKDSSYHSTVKVNRIV